MWVDHRLVREAHEEAPRHRIPDGAARPDDATPAQFHKPGQHTSRITEVCRVLFVANVRMRFHEYSGRHNYLLCEANGTAGADCFIRTRAPAWTPIQRNSSQQSVRPIMIKGRGSSAAKQAVSRTRAREPIHSLHVSAPAHQERSPEKRSKSSTIHFRPAASTAGGTGCPVRLR